MNDIYKLKMQRKKVFESIDSGNLLNELQQFVDQGYFEPNIWSDLYYEAVINDNMSYTQLKQFINHYFYTRQINIEEIILHN